jgi:hypothetical protein
MLASSVLLLWAVVLFAATVMVLVILSVLALVVAKKLAWLGMR